jgi:hypothetical protein
MPRLDQLSDFDFGDGVPNLPPFRGGRGRRPVPGDRPRVSAAVAVLALVLLGQLIVFAAVLFGGHPRIGVASALAVLGCGLLMLAARAARGPVDRW